MTSDPPRAPVASPTASPGPTLSARDREIIAFLAEQRFALAAQLGALLGVSTPTAARRLSGLRSAGLVRTEHRLRHEPGAHRLTAAGLRAAGSRLSAPQPVDLATYRHEVGVGWLAVAAHRGGFGPLAEVVGERRMRSEDRRADVAPGTPTHGVRIGWGPGGGPSHHYPDLVLRTSGGHRVAVELELSTKEPARRERILGAYGADRTVDAVFYLVSTEAAARAIERSARAAGVEDKVRVQRFRWSGDRAPGQPPRARQRVGARRRARPAVEADR